MTELVIYKGVKYKYKGGFIMKFLKNNKQNEKINITEPAIKSENCSPERTLFLIKVSKLLKNMENFDFSVETNAYYR